MLRYTAIKKWMILDGYKDTKIKMGFTSKKYKMLLIYGLQHGLIFPYDDELIGKLRNIYYGGIHASIILLSNGMSNGHCYDSALLMSRAFLDDEDDVKLLYGDIDSLKLNPRFISDSPLYADHCFVERITKDGKHFIYDTSCGFIFDKKMYWLMENPKLRHTNSKESIRRFIEEYEDKYPEDIERDKYASPLILPMIETTFGKPTEIYSLKGIELLQREIEHFKKAIDYDAVVDEINQDMKRLGL